MKKQVLSGLLVLCLIFSLLPVSAFADTAKSGTCGDNLTWTLQDGVLTISGTGNMKNYSMQKVNDKYITTAPWGEYYDTIKSVVIEAGVTSIGDYAFYKCSSLASVTIPDSVTSIGSSAFSFCSSLASVTIPDSVTTIGDWAFYNCSSLTSVTIPDSVTSIGSSVFYNCSSLASVTIPDSVTSIGERAFCDCSSLASVTIPDSVTSIGSSAFRGCSSLASVTIPDSVTSIGGGAFCDCSSLASVTIPNGVTSIGGSVFYGCSSLASVTIPNSVTSIGNSAFYGCSSLASVTIPDSVTSIGDYAFSGCSSLASMTIPDSVTSIGSSAFRGCSSLASVTIPDSVTSIGSSVFEGCISLASVTILDSVTSIGDYAFYKCSKLKDAAFGGTKEEWEATGYTFPSYVRMHYSCKSLDGHYVPVEVKEPNCQSTGYIKYNCSCGNEYTETLPKSHDYVFSKTVAPTCSEHGYDLLKCSKCGAEKKEYHDDELLQHSYVVSAVEPSCLEGGYKLLKCSVCGYSYKDELVQPLGHSETNAEAKAPTCTEAGHTAGTCCSRCGKIMSGMAEIAALGHDFGAWKQTKAPTCTEKGTETRTCTRCNAFEIRDVAPTDHHYTAAVTAPTCTAQGYTTHTCTCDDSYVDSYANALGHSYKNGACTRCGAKNPNYVAAPVLKITTSAGKPQISWNAVDGATKYWIYRSTDGKNFKYYDSTTKTSYTNKSTSIGTTYYYKVKAVKTVDGTNYTSDLSGAKSILCKPAAPTVSIYRTNGKPQLKWSAVTGATKYWIYRSTDGKTFKYYDSTTKTSYTNSGAASGTKYYYRVMAVAVVNGTNVTSANSNTKSLMTTLAKPTVSITTSNGKPKLTWKAVTGADKYYLYRSTDGKNFSYYDSTTKLSYTNAAAKKNTKYYYKVKAICSANTNANSAYSAVVSIKATK